MGNNSIESGQISQKTVSAGGTDLLTSTAVTNPVGRTTGGAVANVPGDLAGTGVLIQESESGTLVAQMALVDTSNSARITANLRWYVSDDDVEYYYAGNTPIALAAGNLASGNQNPWGFGAAGGTARIAMAAPFNLGTNRYVSVIVTNDNTGGDVYTVGVTLSYQR